MSDIPQEYRAEIIMLDADNRQQTVIIDRRLPWSGYVPTYTVMGNPGQPRKTFNPAKLIALGESLRNGQENPTTAMLFSTANNPQIQFMAKDGERRLRGLKLINCNRIWICYDPSVTLENIHAKSFTANFCSEGHTNKETAHAVKKEYDSGKTFAAIGQMAGHSAGWAGYFYNLLRLSPPLLNLMDEPTPKRDRLPASIAKMLWDYSHQDQDEMWKEAKRNTSSKTAAYRWIEANRGRYTKFQGEIHLSEESSGEENHHNGLSPLGVKSSTQGAAMLGTLLFGATAIPLLARSSRGKKPSDFKIIVSTKISKCLEEITFLNGDVWRDRLGEIFPGVDITVIESNLDALISNCQGLKAKIQKAGATEPKAS